MIYIREEEIFQRKFNRFDPDKFAATIEHPTHIPERIMDVFRFYGADGIVRSELSFSPGIEGHRPYISFKEDKGKSFPGWKGTMEFRFEQSPNDFFNAFRREVRWDRAIEYMAPFLRRARKTEASYFGVRYNFVVFVRDLPLVREYFKENDPVKTINSGMQFYRDEAIFMSDWKRNRLPGLLMINPDAGSIIVKKDPTRQELMALERYKAEARVEDDEYIRKHLSEIYAKYDIDYEQLVEASEYLSSSYEKYSVPTAWQLTNDRNIY